MYLYFFIVDILQFYWSLDFGNIMVFTFILYLVVLCYVVLSLSICYKQSPTYTNFAKVYDYLDIYFVTNTVQFSESYSKMFSFWEFSIPELPPSHRFCICLILQHCFLWRQIYSKKVKMTYCYLSYCTN